MKRFVILAALLATMPPIWAQISWFKNYGTGEADETGVFVQETSNWHFLVIGQIYHPDTEKSEVWLFKAPADYDILWEKTYGGEWEMQICGRVTSDEGFIIAASANMPGGGGYNLWLLKADENGDTLWSKVYGGPMHDIALSVDETDDGGYIIAGFCNALEDEEGRIMPGDLWLVKTDAGGELEWEKIYGEEDAAEWATSAYQTSDEGYIIACSGWYSEVTLDDVTLMKADENGDSLWTNRDGGTSLDCVIENSDGDFIGCGIKMGDLVLLKVDQNGNKLWDKTWGKSPPANDWGNWVEETANGGYLMAATYGHITYTNGQTEDGDIWVLKTDSEGDTLWSRILGKNPQYDAALCVRQTSDGGFIAAGATETWGTDLTQDLILVYSDTGKLAVEAPLITTLASEWEIVTSIGSCITLRYSDLPGGFHTGIFDASGCKVADLQSAEPSGTLTWGEDRSPGVYFVRVASEKSVKTQKLILIR